MDNFLRRARRRHLLLAVFEQATFAACAAAAGLLLLLLVGTQILDWYWPVLLFGAGLGFALWRLRTRIPDTYRLAQWVDARLGFRDSLSTAYHFRDAERTSVVELQQREAEALSASADLTMAVPAHAPRSLYVLAGLFAVAVMLFGMRYLTTHRLDLKAPIAELHFSSFDTPTETASRRKSAVEERLDAQLKQLGMGLDPVDDHPGEKDPPLAPDGVVATPDGKAPIDSGQKAASGTEKGESGTPQPESNEKGQGANPSDDKDGLPADLPGLNLNGKNAQQQAANKNSAGQNGQHSSLLDKMRDAMANLMAKMNLKSPPQAQQASNNGQMNGTQPGQGQKSGPTQQAKSEGRQQGSPNGESDSESGEQAQAGAGKSNDRGGDKPGGQDSKTGMGKQDGNKDLVDAEQLAAMGKISEIIGRRSAQMSGEMTVEVPSGKQQLKTAYTRKRAAHGDTGGEISREEIPLQLQPYVQRYFEEIRKVPVPRSETPTKTRG